MQDYSVPLNVIINMDQTAIDLSDVFKVSLETKGSKSVKIRSLTNLPKRITILLAISFSGAYLKPHVVFHGLPGGRIEREFSSENYSRECVFGVQKNAWTDQSIMNAWISKVLKPHLDNVRHGSSQIGIVMLDNFSVHCTEETSTGLANQALSKLLLLPPNTTSQTQPLDVGINKPFKDRIRNYYLEYLTKPGVAESGKVTREMISTWIEQSWEACRTQIDISNTLFKIGFKRV